LNQSECIYPRNSRAQMILCAMLLCSIAHSIIVHGCLVGKCILTGSTE
jgi:carbonic anhydrase/acetyltransferase-like protein (isoleucine patch superfamily)